MRDLSQALEAAKYRTVLAEYSFRSILDGIRNDAGSKLSWDWDSGVPEDWASGWISGERVVLLWRNGSFAFIDDGAPGSLVQALTLREISTERVSNWAVETYSLNREMVDELFGPTFPHDEVDVSAISIQDLWWATVT